MSKSVLLKLLNEIVFHIFKTVLHHVVGPSCESPHFTVASTLLLTTASTFTRRQLVGRYGASIGQSRVG
jgi:hypothetical protein